MVRTWFQAVQSATQPTAAGQIKINSISGFRRRGWQNQLVVETAAEVYG